MITLLIVLSLLVLAFTSPGITIAIKGLIELAILLFYVVALAIIAVLIFRSFIVEKDVPVVRNSR